MLVLGDGSLNYILYATQNHKNVKYSLKNSVKYEQNFKFILLMKKLITSKKIVYGYITKINRINVNEQKWKLLNSSFIKIKFFDF